MCIIFLIINSNPSPNGYKAIIAANRDEYYARPALSANKWEECQHVYGGRDMEPGREGGTWLAVGTKTKIFKFGTLLNLTGEPKTENSIGRGQIVANYVKGDLSNIEYTTYLINSRLNYNIYNFVSIEINKHISCLIHTSNAPLSTTKFELNIPYGFGNSDISSPLKKVVGGLGKFKNILHLHSESNANILIDNLLCLLSDNEKYWPDSELKRRSPDLAENLSRIFVKIPEIGYGTRTKSVILLDAKDKMHFYETTMVDTDPNRPWKVTHFVSEF